MATKYFALLTNIGAAKLANATALGAQVEITQMAVGDGNGALPTPNPAQTTLTHELRRAQLNMLTIDPVNTNQIIAEQVIPEDVGGWWIREIGLFDKDGDMIAIANCAETYKPQLQEGSGRVQVIRVILIVSNTEAVTLKIDPSVVLATRGYVDNLIETRQQKSDTLTALAALKPAKGKLPYFTAEKAAALADLSDFIRLMLNKGDAAGVLEYLGLGGAAKLNVGTTAGTVAAGDDPRFNADFGEGQSWQNVKASRAAGVTYTNSSGKMIAVSISTRNGAIISTATVDTVVVSAFTSNNSGTILSSIFLLVPSGSTYGISSSASLAGTDTSWVEFR